MIRKFKFFFRPISDLTKWLNQMSDKGYRLIRTGSIFYYFKKCEKTKYIYAVDFVANKSYSELKEYEDFLSESNIRYMEKPASIGKISKGNIRWRPYADKGARMATSNAMIKRELLILEKENDGKEFEINTNRTDKINALRIMRKPTIMMLLLIGLLILMSNTNIIPQYQRSLFKFDLFNGVSNSLIMIIFGTIEILLLFNLIRYNVDINLLKKESKIHE